MGFFSTLFGRNEHHLPRIMQTMESRTKVAMGALLYSLMEEVGVDKTQEPKERERLGRRAAYQARLLLSEPLKPSDQETIIAAVEVLGAAVFMEKYPLMMELVVQTLRVKNTIYFARYGKVAKPPIGVELLENYGPRIVDEPNPDNYETLIQKVIDSMSEIGKARISHFIANAGADVG